MVPPSRTRAALESFRRALDTGDLQGLLDVLAPEAVFIGDGGGVKRAAARPIVGADKVARFLIGGTAEHAATLAGVLTMVNGSPALALHLDGEFDGVMAVRLEDSRIAGISYVRNPQKPTHLATETSLTLR